MSLVTVQLVILLGHWVSQLETVFLYPVKIDHCEHVVYAIGILVILLKLLADVGLSSRRPIFILQIL